MDIKKLVSINTKFNNITKMPMPYWWGVDKKIGRPSEDPGKKMVVFFGNDMMATSGLGVAERDLYFAKCNECLDFIRRNFNDYALYYKPHPVDEKEPEKESFFLNLKGFNLVEEKITAELFLWNNLNRIRATFSIGSWSSFGAYSMGLNSYVFYKCFSGGIYPKEYIWSHDIVFSEMPEPFFISDFNQRLIANERMLEKDKLLELNLKKVLSKNTGKVWLICSFSESIVMLTILSELIKSLAPARQVGLIVNRSHRWDVINTDYFKNYFDEIFFLPRIFYSLKPVRLWKAVKTAWRIKNFKVFPGDVLIAATQPEFVENCLISYHKNNLRIGFMTARDFNGQYNHQNAIFTKHNDFRFNKATWFFNKIFEPLLGLNRTVYMAFSQEKSCYVNRYQKPINEIFDELYIMDIPK